jgi:NAD(P)H-nitrite reductase large subunit
MSEAARKKPDSAPFSEGDPERTICFCHSVSCRQLLEAIRAGACTHHDIQVTTCASTGCGGCEPEVLEILEGELKAELARKGG